MAKHPIQRLTYHLRKLLRREYRAVDIGSNGINIHLGFWPAGPQSVLCIHGMTANHLCFDAIARSLQAEGKSVHALDLRGRGTSDRPDGPYSVMTHVEDIRGILEKLSGRQVLIGHSLGAFIAIQVAAHLPDHLSGLILIDGGGALSVRQKLRALGAIKPSLGRLGQVFSDIEDYFDQARFSGFFSDWNKTIEKFLRYELAEVPDGFKQNINPEHIETELRSMGGSMRTSKIAAGIFAHPIESYRKMHFMNTFPYEQIRCPTLILRAGRYNLTEGDYVLPLSSMHEMLRRIPDCRGYTVQSVNHFEIILGGHDERDQLLNEFIDSLPD